MKMFMCFQSRVVLQHGGERNFHAFYQLLTGGSDKLLSSLHLKRDHKSYSYISQGTAHPVNSINDKQDYQTVTAALSALGLSAPHLETVWRIVAAILHLVSQYRQYNSFFEFCGALYYIFMNIY